MKQRLRAGDRSQICYMGHTARGAAASEREAEMKVKPIAEVLEYLAPAAEETGVEIVDAAWNMRERSLTIWIDAEEGVDLNLCERFHHAADALLDELDPTFGAAYTLNCSSLGLDWPIKTDRDFLRRLHEQVEVHLYAPVDGKKEYEGELLSFNEETFTILTDKGERTFERAKAAKVCLAIQV